MKQKGASLISVVIIFFILSLLGLSILGVMFNRTYRVQNDYERLSAVYIAESGIEYVKAIVVDSTNSKGDNGNNNNGGNRSGDNGQSKKDNIDTLQQTLNNYIGHIENMGIDRYFIIKNILLLDESNKNGNGNPAYTIFIASEGYNGKVVYTAYAKLLLDVHGNSSSLSVQAWKVIKGNYKYVILNNL